MRRLICVLALLFPPLCGQGLSAAAHAAEQQSAPPASSRASPPASSPARSPAITEAEIRTLAARQARALNAGDLRGYVATLADRAVLAQQALGSDNSIVPYGSSTVSQARAQLRRLLATSTLTETVAVTRVVIDPTGRGAALSAEVRTEVAPRAAADGRLRRSCARRLATFARIDGRLRMLSQTDTLVRCRRAA